MGIAVILQQGRPGIVMAYHPKGAIQPVGQPVELMDPVVQRFGTHPLYKLSFLPGQPFCGARPEYLLSAWFFIVKIDGGYTEP